MVVNYQLITTQRDVVGGAFDTTSTLAIASLAKKPFLEDGVAIGDGTVIDKKVLEVVPEENN
ncbi:hypothetical protein [Liquorilactobacillus hordei]|uniref:Uncharacterized protein n=1 Tax=Liquorilactobacillus hordei TaxID=468911 RepID=A0A3S6QMI1_9LACO|nr:hypothetical protein [Liquorilactobacillus hordei]AUJ29100.1 hypothetical protein BSQ49_02075 [Liquorilactobacillus hordei]